MRFIMHSYSFRAYPLDYAMRSALRFGYGGIELQPVHINLSDLGNALPAALELAGRYRVPIACLDYSGDFIQEEQSAIDASVAGIEEAIDLCAAQNITLLNGFCGWLVQEPQDFGQNGSAIAEDKHYDRAAEALNHLGKYAADCGVTLAVEIHMNTIHDSIASTARLLEKVTHDNVVANPDFGNMFSVPHAERDPNQLDLLAGRIGYVHLKNCRHVGGTYDFGVTLSEGHINTHLWIDKLMRLGYDGDFCIEYCGEGDPHRAAEDDLGYLRKLLDWSIG